ncbi:MAG: AAA family ATPase [Intrasporangium sp.]|uniref:helix-turn-helix transcriptional regulator n=1 Tax=Intrasporangium sp. TaxID=1925024 RepID=UPI002648B859|nr:AAA family ATPase [Intrasporangium sp.]MDN5797649.1 AAA family ATPase [Intrasporangium sp.]
MSVPGRDVESAQLAVACREAAAGTGRLVLLTGEAGIGKSRLAQVAAEEASSLGMADARGWCMDDPAAPALWPWWRVARDVDGLGDALASIQGVDADDGVRWRLAEAVAAALARRASDAGLAVVLEDLHWADPLTLDLLRRLLPEIISLPVLLVGTARQEGLAPVPMGAVLPDLLRATNIVHVPVPGLTASAVASWLAEEPRTRDWASHADHLARQTGGNPFYIRTLVSELSHPDADVSAALTDRPTWRAVLVAPYRKLPGPARQTVATAAVMGERLAPRLLADALGHPVEEVSEHLARAVISGILHFAVTGLAFNHALVRDAIVADLGPAERARADACVAAALERTGDPMMLGPAAIHWSRVEGPEAAARCRDLAARAAAAQAFAPVRGLELARLALESARALDATEEELAERLLVAARFEWAGGMLVQALESCTSGLELAEAAGRPDLMADFALVPQGIGSVDIAQIAEGLCRRALAVLPAAEGSRRARLLALCAVAAAEAAASPQDRTAPVRGGQTPADLAAEAVAAARACTDRQAELETVAARHFVLSYPQSIEERTRLAARAVELGGSSSTTIGALWGYLWQADLAFQRGELLAVQQAIADVERVAARRSSPVARWHTLRLRSALGLLTGHFDEARDLARQARSLADRVGDISMVGLHYAFHVQLGLLRGDPSELLPDTLEALGHAPPLPLVRASVPVSLVMQGDLAGARAEFVALRAVPRRMPLGPRWAGTVGQIGVAAVLLADAEVATECYHVMSPTSQWCGGDGGGSPFAAGSNEYQLGLLAHTFGNRPLAADHFRRGIAVDDRIGARPYAALGRLGLAEALADHNLGQARRQAREAADELRRLDMPGPLARASALSDAADRTLPRATARPGGLTEREYEVALLAGQAMTNRQIADRLFLSVRTVESHVRSALTKLDLTSRTQLALWLRDHET